MATRTETDGKERQSGAKRAPKAEAEPAKAAAAGHARKPEGREASGQAPWPGGRTALVIVESPTKAKTIGKYLGSGYDVKATIGHLRDLPTRELGVDVENGFEPKYVTIKGKTKTLAELKKAAKAASAIYLATDPDREGEAIAWHVADQISSPSGCRLHRVLFHEITKDAVQEAHRNPGRIDEQKVDAQQARRILDRLVGYKASPILWNSIKTGLSAGRVQTVALRLIVEREREIRAFKPQEYWTIEALCAKDGQTFEAPLAQDRGPQAAARERGRGPGGGGRGAEPPVRRHQGGASEPQEASGGAVHHQHRCSRKRPRSWASPPGAPCARRRTSTKAWMSGRRGRSVSSPTCGPTRSGWPTPPIASARELHRADSTPSATCPKPPTCTATGRTPGCRAPTKPSGPPT